MDSLDDSVVRRRSHPQSDGSGPLRFSAIIYSQPAETCVAEFMAAR